METGYLEVLRVTDQDAETDSRVPGIYIPGVWLCPPVVANRICGQNSTCLDIGSYISSNENQEVYLKISRDIFIQEAMENFVFPHEIVRQS